MVLPEGDFTGGRGRPPGGFAVERGRGGILKLLLLLLLMVRVSLLRVHRVALLRAFRLVNRVVLLRGRLGRCLRVRQIVVTC